MNPNHGYSSQGGYGVYPTYAQQQSAGAQQAGAAQPAAAKQSAESPRTGNAVNAYAAYAAVIQQTKEAKASAPTANQAAVAPVAVKQEPKEANAAPADQPRPAASSAGAAAAFASASKAAAMAAPSNAPKASSVAWPSQALAYGGHGSSSTTYTPGLLGTGREKDPAQPPSQAYTPYGGYSYGAGTPAYGFAKGGAAPGKAGGKGSAKGQKTGAPSPPPIDPLQYRERVIQLNRKPGEKLGLDLDGTKVTRVWPGAIGDKAGIKEGMTITHIDDMPVASLLEVKAAFTRATQEQIKVGLSEPRVKGKLDPAGRYVWVSNVPDMLPNYAVGEMLKAHGRLFQYFRVGRWYAVEFATKKDALQAVGTLEDVGVMDGGSAEVTAEYARPNPEQLEKFTAVYGAASLLGPAKKPLPAQAPPSSSAQPLPAQAAVAAAPPRPEPTPGPLAITPEMTPAAASPAPAPAMQAQAADPNKGAKPVQADYWRVRGWKGAPEQAVEFYKALRMSIRNRIFTRGVVPSSTQNPLKLSVVSVYPLPFYYVPEAVQELVSLASRFCGLDVPEIEKIDLCVGSGTMDGQRYLVATIKTARPVGASQVVGTLHGQDSLFPGNVRKGAGFKFSEVCAVIGPAESPKIIPPTPTPVALPSTVDVSVLKEEEALQPCRYHHVYGKCFLPGCKKSKQGKPGNAMAFFKKSLRIDNIPKTWTMAALTKHLHAACGEALLREILWIDQFKLDAPAPTHASPYSCVLQIARVASVQKIFDAVKKNAMVDSQTLLEVSHLTKFNPIQGRLAEQTELQAAAAQQVLKDRTPAMPTALPAPPTNKSTCPMPTAKPAAAPASAAKPAATRTPAPTAATQPTETEEFRKLREEVAQLRQANQQLVESSMEVLKTNIVPQQQMQTPGIAPSTGMFSEIGGTLPGLGLGGLGNINLAGLGGLNFGNLNAGGLAGSLGGLDLTGLAGGLGQLGGLDLHSLASLTGVLAPTAAATAAPSAAAPPQPPAVVSAAPAAAPPPPRAAKAGSLTIPGGPAASDLKDVTVESLIASAVKEQNKKDKSAKKDAAPAPVSLEKITPKPVARSGPSASAIAEMACGTCGKRGHTDKDCPAMDEDVKKAASATCKLCGLRGHTAGTCPKQHLYEEPEETSALRQRLGEKKAILAGVTKDIQAAGKKPNPKDLKLLAETRERVKHYEKRVRESVDAYAENHKPKLKTAAPPRDVRDVRDIDRDRHRDYDRDKDRRSSREREADSRWETTKRERVTRDNREERDRRDYDYKDVQSTRDPRDRTHLPGSPRSSTKSQMQRDLEELSTVGLRNLANKHNIRVDDLPSSTGPAVKAALVTRLMQAEVSQRTPVPPPARPFAPPVSRSPAAPAPPARSVHRPPAAPAGDDDDDDYMPTKGVSRVVANNDDNEDYVPMHAGTKGWQPHAVRKVDPNARRFYG
eukprot:TRINITY_DN20975_c0_g1_i1.p1 TRINITY_DN20975_c0_g1~~TRINITY_DN20975_c0_g1_i1.p1  ORF type:complete len:1435 (+),score=294.39 TRINITY_DN20975_c0_g1_i1:72-4376(+)